MGLDVYLYWEKDRKEISEFEDRIDKVKTDAWHEVEAGRKFTDLSDEEKDRVFAAGKKALVDAGLPETGEIPETLQRCIEIPSEKFPEHYFKIGYFRSSYNDGGINHVLSIAEIPGLYEIFGVDHNNHEYSIVPDWNASKDRALKAIAQYREYLKNSGGFITERIRSAPRPTVDEKGVLDSFLNEYKKWKDSGSDERFSCYENASAAYFLKGNGIKVFAVYPNVSPGCFGPETILVVKRPDDWNPDSDWYYQALLIVVETIDYVLAQPDKEHYSFHWSA